MMVSLKVHRWAIIESFSMVVGPFSRFWPRPRIACHQGEYILF